MPVGMFLRSPWAGSHLSDPDCSLTLDAYREASGKAFAAPVPLVNFIEYGQWFKERVVPDVDRRQVKLIEADRPGFLLTLSDGTKVRAPRVIVAAGIGSFAWRPEPFRGLPSSLSSHSSEHSDLGVFAGRLVAVIGAGQSALETAALMHEAGAEVELMVRAPQVRFLRQIPLLRKWPLEPLLYAPPDVGPALASHLIARPDLYRRMPRRWQDRMGIRAIRSAGSDWLKPRLEKVKTTCGRFVARAEPEGERLRLKLDDGGERVVDHAFLGTGYRVDVWKYTFIAPELLTAVSKIDGYPMLSDSFESSVPGLYFIGAPAAWSFGPLMRFVAGTRFTSLKLAHGIAREAGGLRRFNKTAGGEPLDLPVRPGPGHALFDTNSASSSIVGNAGAMGLEPARPAGVLLTGADYRALGVARSLGRHGVPVSIMRKPDQLLASFSRYVQRIFTWPRCDGTSYVEYLLRLADRNDMKGWLLLPTDDEMVGFIARHHDQLSTQFLLAIPPWEKLRWVCDKRLLNQLADQLEMDQPRTFCPGSRAEVQELDYPFPVIIKPALHDSFNPCLCPIYQLSQLATYGPTVAKTSNRLTVDKAWRMDDRESLLAGYDQACAQIPSELVMVQEVVPGSGDSQFSYAALCSRGQPLVAVAARRVRQFPMDFGRLSTFVETVEEHRMAREAVRLLQALGYTGLVEVEFKLDSRDGRFKLLDVNPRVWGWHTLGARAGVDFSYLYWRMLQGEPVAETQGRPGVGWMHLTADVPMAMQEILSGRLSLREYFRSFIRPLETAIFVLDDPMPGLLEIPLLVYSRIMRMLAPRTLSSLKIQPICPKEHGKN
jgi:predicted ATP-grasp superfamily ATP-dependent carboligase